MTTSIQNRIGSDRPGSRYIDPQDSMSDDLGCQNKQRVVDERVRVVLEARPEGRLEELRPKLALQGDLWLVAMGVIERGQLAEVEQMGR